MRYLFWGVLSLFAASCTGANADVCRALAGPTAIETSRSMDRVTAKSREATVELASVRPKGIAYGTGTLFKYKGRTIIITAAHVVGSTKSRVLVMDGSKEASTSIVYFDERQDIIRLTVSSRNPDKDELKRINVVVATLCDKYGYNASSANKLLRYVSSLMARN